MTVGVTAIEKARKEPMENGILYKMIQQKAACALDIWLDQEAELTGVVISRSLSEAGLDRTVTGRELNKMF